MTGNANETQWYIARDGKQHGPLTDVEMRTFIAHSYLRSADLIWRPGMTEWQTAQVIFPEAFGGKAPSETPLTQSRAPASSATAAKNPAAPPQGARTSDFDVVPDLRGEGRPIKRLAIAAAAVTMLAGGAYALATYHEPLFAMVSGGKGSGTPPPTVSAPSESKIAQKVVTPQVIPSSSSDKPEAPAATAAPAAAPAAPASPAPQPTTTASVAPASASPPAATAPAQKNTQVAALQPTVPAAPPTIDGSQTDTKLQKIPVWALIKREYPDWYSAQVTAAEKLVQDKKPDSDVAMLLSQGLVNLRRQNAEKALAASSDKLQKIAETFLAHLKALRAQSVSACFGFISRGEVSPAVVQMMEHPESATTLNAEAGAIFEAISEGTHSPVKHDAAVKSDYDVLIKELSKLGWKEEDLQVFSNPKLLAKREPEQVCKLVQEWFIAHLAVPDAAVRERLLYETLKPVVTG